MPRFGLTLSLVFSIVLFMSIASLADMPGTMNYQGYLNDAGGNPISDTLAMTFVFYNQAVDGSILGSESFAEVVIDSGYFFVTLGESQAIADDIFQHNEVWLEVRVDGETMTPRVHLAKVPYSSSVASVEGAEGGQLIGNLQTTGTIRSGNSIIIDGGNDKITTTSDQLTFDINDVIFSDKITVGQPNANTGLYSLVTGKDNAVSNNYSSIIGGQNNQVSSSYSAISGGMENSVSGTYSSISGGYGNSVTSPSSFIGGGNGDIINGSFSAITGGYECDLNASYSSICGGNNNSVNEDYSLVCGGWHNDVSGIVSSIVGGRYNYILGQYSVICGGGSQDEGYGNEIFGNYSVIGGGSRNTIDSVEGIWNAHSVIGGGFNNHTYGRHTTIAGGYYNSCLAQRTSIGGGEENTAGGDYATISGGYTNTAGGFYSCIPGGRSNQATGDFSFAAGYNAHALHDGAFVWNDGHTDILESTGDDQFLIKASGGVGIGTNILNPAEAMLRVQGVIHANTGGFRFPDGTLQTTAADNGTGGDITAVYADDGLAGGGESGDVHIDINTGTGLEISADAVQMTPSYSTGGAYDSRFVNEGQSNSVNSAMIEDGTISFDDIDQNGATEGQVVTYDGSDWVAQDNVGQTGFFPAPMYDSHWFRPHEAGDTLFHNLSIDPVNMLVDLIYWDIDDIYGINNKYFGGAIDGSSDRGAYYANLTENSVVVYRFHNDGQADSARVRIWVIADD